MIYKIRNNQFLLFLRLFIILFILLFILPKLIDSCLRIFIPCEPPQGGSVLVSKNLYDSLSFWRKYLSILKNLIISL
ncbi:MAG: hypothetical protein K0R84_1433 [Clostridia bacterium]|nr:hypothetical protein [Clostridia bacterium]